MRSLRNAASHKLLVFLFLAIIPAIAIALASPVWLGHETKTHAAPAQSVTQQGAPPAPALPRRACAKSLRTANV